MPLTVPAVNSATLVAFGHSTTGEMNVSFTMANNVASSLAALMGMTGNHNNIGLSGTLDATPEPASLALFGTGLLLVGIRLTRHRKRQE